MSQSTLLAALSLVFVTGGKLATDYTKERSLKIVVDSTIKTETAMKRDGQTDDRGGGISSESERHIVQIDHVLAHEGDAPTKVTRKFVELKNNSVMMFGENERTDDHEGALVGVTLQLEKGTGGAVEVKAIDGKAEGESLEGHKLELALDALLPSGDSKSVDLDKAAVNRVLGFDVSKALYPPPAPPSDSGSGGSGGGGGRGRSRGPGGMSTGFLQTADWEGTAKLADADEDYEGHACAVIEVVLSAKGDLPEPSRDSGTRGRSFDPSRGFEPAGNTYEVELKGKLYFDREHHMPVHLELEGKLASTMHSEFTRGDQKMSFDSETEGTIKYEVTVSVAKDE
jgi:hypothetical protein